MQDWDFSAPPLSDLNDHDVEAVSQKLAGKSIALLICGSIAAYRSPDLIRELRRHGASVQVFASKPALLLVSELVLSWTSGNKVVKGLSADAEHLESDATYDLVLVAPASYNSINKFACGIADDIIPLAFSSALGRLERGDGQIAIAPCMNGQMHNSILVDNMKRLASLGVQFIAPRQEDGKNKLPEIPSLITDVLNLLS